MFGNKKKILEEQNRNLLAQLSEKKETFETSVTEIEETGKRIHTDLCQVMENTENLVEHAMVNIEEESKLMFRMDDFSKELKNAVDNYEELLQFLLRMKTHNLKSAQNKNPLFCK